jgi:predicted nuclease of restriction endonuclease-like (RecB) superfamily
MSRCKDPLEREFYIRMTRKFGWSKNVLLPTKDSGIQKDKAVEEWVVLLKVGL